MTLEIFDLKQWCVYKIQFWDIWHFVFLQIYPIKTTLSYHTVKWFSIVLFPSCSSVLMNHSSKYFGNCVIGKMQTKPVRGQCLKRSKGPVSCNLVIDYVIPFIPHQAWLTLALNTINTCYLSEWVLSSQGKCANFTHLW